MSEVRQVGLLFTNKPQLVDWGVLAERSPAGMLGNAASVRFSADSMVGVGSPATAANAAGATAVVADAGIPASAAVAGSQQANSASMQVAASEQAASMADVLVDNFMLTTFEAMARVFVGLHARSYALWTGGVYNMVGLCSPDPVVRATAARRGSALWPRIAAMEHLLASEHADPEVHNFAQGFLWHQGTVYREMVQLLSEGREDDAAVYCWRIFSSVLHEKGVCWPKHANHLDPIEFCFVTPPLAFHQQFDQQTLAKNEQTLPSEASRMSSRFSAGSQRRAARTP